MRVSFFDNPLLGIAVGSVIATGLLYLPFSGLLGNFFIPGVPGVLFVLSLGIPGAAVAGLLSYDGNWVTGDAIGGDPPVSALAAYGAGRGTFPGGVTALVGYLALITVLVPDLFRGPFTDEVLVELAVGVGLMLVAVGLVFGAVAGAVAAYVLGWLEKGTPS